MNKHNARKAVDDRHPQEQGLKRRTRAMSAAAGVSVDDRHPQEQGLKPSA